MELQAKTFIITQRLHKLLPWTGLGFLHWFFGNLYESIVLGPNLLFADDQVKALNSFRAFFSVSSPPFYFLPWSPLSVILVWIGVYFASTIGNQLVRRWLTATVLFSSTALGLTIYLVTNVNVDLYFTATAYDPAALDILITRITWLGSLRLLLLLSTLFSLYRAYRALSLFCN